MPSNEAFVQSVIKRVLNSQISDQVGVLDLNYSLLPAKSAVIPIVFRWRTAMAAGQVAVANAKRLTPKLFHDITP